MYKVLGLQDFGIWCKKGEEHELNNYLTEMMVKRNVVKVIKFLGNYPYGSYHLRQSIRSMKLQIEYLELKIKNYEDMLK